jgi:hypothetical protein
MVADEPRQNRDGRCAADTRISSTHVGNAPCKRDGGGVGPTKGWADSMIQYSRGSGNIVNREGLEAAA